MKKTVLYRAVFYALGLLILALGLTLNTKAGLGVSAIISVAYSISLIFELNFGNVTLGLYTVFVIAQMILHTVNGKRREENSEEALVHANRASLKFILLADILQIPLSIVFTRFLNVFSDVLPEIPSGTMGTVPEMTLRVILLLIAITFTGIGAAMSLNMRIIPNPGDGIVQAIADCIHKSTGFAKNCFDLVNITFAVAVSLIFAGELRGVGIGTVLAVIGVGRVIAVFNHFTYGRMKKLAGVEE